jgi:hypothetical protein
MSTNATPVAYRISHGGVVVKGETMEKFLLLLNALLTFNANRETSI